MSNVTDVLDLDQINNATRVNLVIHRKPVMTDALPKEIRQNNFFASILKSLPFVNNLNALQVIAEGGNDSDLADGTILNAVLSKLKDESDRVRRLETILREGGLGKDTITNIFNYYLAYQIFVLKFVRKWDEYAMRNSGLYTKCYRMLTDYVYTYWAVELDRAACQYFGNNKINVFTTEKCLAYHEYPALLTTTSLSESAPWWDVYRELLYKKFMSEYGRLSGLEDYLTYSESHELLKDLFYYADQRNCVKFIYFNDVVDVLARKEMEDTFVANYADGNVDEGRIRVNIIEEGDHAVGISLYPAILKCINFKGMSKYAARDYCFNYNDYDKHTARYVLQSHEQIHGFVYAVGLFLRYQEAVY